MFNETPRGIGSIGRWDQIDGFSVFNEILRVFVTRDYREGNEIRLMFSGVSGWMSFLGVQRCDDVGLNAWCILSEMTDWDLHAYILGCAAKSLRPDCVSSVRYD